MWVSVQIGQSHQWNLLVVDVVLNLRPNLFWNMLKPVHRVHGTASDTWVYRWTGHHALCFAVGFAAVWFSAFGVAAPTQRSRSCFSRPEVSGGKKLSVWSCRFFSWSYRTDLIDVCRFRLLKSEIWELPESAISCCCELVLHTQLGCPEVQRSTGCGFHGGSRQHRCFNGHPWRLDDFGGIPVSPKKFRVADQFENKGSIPCSAKGEKWQLKPGLGRATSSLQYQRVRESGRKWTHVLGKFTYLDQTGCPQACHEWF